MGWGMRKEIQDSLENHICLTTENEAEMRIKMCLSIPLLNLREEKRELGREGEEKEDTGPGRETAEKRSRVEKEGGHWSRKGGLGRLTYSEKQC